MVLEPEISLVVSCGPKAVARYSLVVFVDSFPCVLFLPYSTFLSFAALSASWYRMKRPKQCNPLLTDSLWQYFLFTFSGFLFNSSVFLKICIGSLNRFTTQNITSTCWLLELYHINNSKDCFSFCFNSCIWSESISVIFASDIQRIFFFFLFCFV